MMSHFDRKGRSDHGSDTDSDTVSISSTPATSLGTLIDDGLHNLPIAELEKILNTNLKTGMTNEDARLRLLSDGRNEIKPAPPKYLGKIIGYFVGGFCWLLWIATIVVFLAWKPLGQPPAVANLALAIVLIIVIFFQAGFTAFQDWTSSKAMKAIVNMMPQFANVFRGGEKAEVPIAELVKGDLVEIKTGGKIGADLRILQCNGLKIDKSILTGESIPVTATIESTSASFTDSANIALMGTTVIEGTGVGVVLRIGEETLMGQVAKLSNKSHIKRTILQKEVIRFTSVIAALALITATFCMIIWACWLRVDYPNFLNLSNMLSTDMGIIVAFVPEGFPIAVTLILTIIARRMKVQNVLVKTLTIVETLGCVNVVCSDKTGTLTTNKMTVVQFSYFNKAQNVNTAIEEGSEKRPSQTLIHSIAHLCNNATFNPADDKLPVAVRRVFGDATDAALLRFAGQTVDVEAEKKRFDLVHVIPFSSKTKCMITMFMPKEDTLKEQHLFGHTGDIGPFLLVKGAPEVLYKRCKYYLDPENPLDRKEFTPKDREAVEEMQAAWSAQALRVLLLAYRPIDQEMIARLPGEEAPSFEELLDELVVVGFVGIVDPPREETAGVVATCREAGIRFFMVTGDFPVTAMAIAKNVGIFKGSVIHQASDLLNHPRPLEVEDGGKRKTKRARFSFSRWVRTQVRRIHIALRFPGQAPFEEVKRDPFVYRFVRPEKRKFKGMGLVLSGSDLNQLEEYHWDLIDHYDEVVFARTTPEQKYTIVKELQKRKNVVAVTGDGVNDAPALRNAHIGVGMGSGSDAAMEAASMVLMDSNFSSIVNALRQGRIVFENLKKMSLYLLPGGTFSELLSVLTNIFLGLPTPLSSFLMIFVSVCTDVYPALALMYEPPESDVLTKPPRRAGKDRLVDWKLLVHAYIFLGTPIAIVAHFLYFLYMYREWGVHPGDLVLAFDKWGVEGYAGLSAADQGLAVRGAQGVYFVTIVMMQLFGNLVNTRNRHLSMIQQNVHRNTYIFVAMICAIASAALLLYVPFFNDIIATYPIPAEYWFLPLPFALYLIAFDETRKWYLRRWPESRVARFSW